MILLYYHDIIIIMSWYYMFHNVWKNIQILTHWGSCWGRNKHTNIPKNTSVWFILFYIWHICDLLSCKICGLPCCFPKACVKSMWVHSFFLGALHFLCLFFLWVHWNYKWQNQESTAIFNDWTIISAVSPHTIL